MGKIKQKRIRWTRSNSPEVINYKVYWSEDDMIGYDSDHELVGDVEELLLPADVASLPLIKSAMSLGISAVDRAGNESDITVLSVDVDFTVPEPPRELRVEDPDAPPAAPTGLQVEDL